MLPGRAGNRTEEKTRHAEDAIDDLLGKIKNPRAEIADLEISLIGGADLLGEGDIHLLVKDSILGYLRHLGTRPKLQRLGGDQPRSVWLEVGSGRILYTEGGIEAKELR